MPNRKVDSKPGRRRNSDAYLVQRIGENMTKYLVETLSVDGTWVPKDGVYETHSLFSASVETFEARLKGQRSRIIEVRTERYGSTWATLVTVPPKADYVTPRNLRRYLSKGAK
jgi:hypothetical protein